MMKTMEKRQEARKNQERTLKRMMAYQKKRRADGQQEKNEPSHDQKGVKAYDEQKRIL